MRHSAGCGPSARPLESTRRPLFRMLALLVGIGLWSGPAGPSHSLAYDLQAAPVLRPEAKEAPKEAPAQPAKEPAKEPAGGSGPKESPPGDKAGKEASSKTAEAQLPRRIPIQEMIARVDQVLRVPEGLLTGRLSAITRAGDTAVWDFTLYRKTLGSEDIRETGMLYQFSSKRRGLEAKLLYREDGEVIWLYDNVRRSLFRKRDLERFQGVLGTGFTYTDLANSGYQAGYSGRTARFLQEKQGLLAKLTMVPINPGRYSMLELLADPRDRYRPYRIDFHDRDRVLFKTLNLHYGAVLDRRTGREDRPGLPTRLEMLDLKNGMISRLEYFTLDRSVKPEDAFFDPEYLNR